MTSKGKFIAAAAAGLFLAAPSIAAAEDKAESKGHCAGVNACKGKGGCKSADNECKGKNGCKGKSFTETTEKACKAEKGTFTAMK